MTDDQHELDVIQAIRDETSPGAIALQQTDDAIEEKAFEESEALAMNAYRSSPLSQPDGGPSPEQYDYTTAFREGQTFEVDDDGGVPVQNKYVRPGQIGMGGFDVGDGHAALDNGLSPHGNRWVEAGLREIQNSSTNPQGVQNFATDTGLSKAAHGFMSEGATFDQFAGNVRSPVVSDKQIQRSWIAASNVRDRRQIEQELTDIGVQQIEFLSANPDIANKMIEEDDANKDIEADTLPSDTDWLDSGKDMYEMTEGEEFEGSNEELSDWVLDRMVRVNHNTLYSAYIITNLMSATPKQGQSFLKLMDTYDRVNLDTNIFMRLLLHNAWDPINLIGFGTAKLAALATKAGKRPLFAAIIDGSIGGVVEGAAIGAIEDVTQQSAQVAAGEKENIDAGQVAGTAAVGAVVGGAIGGTIGAGAHVAIPAIKKGYDWMKNQVDPIFTRLNAGVQ